MITDITQNCQRFRIIVINEIKIILIMIIASGIY